MDLRFMSDLGCVRERLALLLGLADLLQNDLQGLTRRGGWNAIDRSSLRQAIHEVLELEEVSTQIGQVATLGRRRHSPNLGDNRPFAIIVDGQHPRVEVGQTSLEDRAKGHTKGGGRGKVPAAL